MAALTPTADVVPHQVPHPQATEEVHHHHHPETGLADLADHRPLDLEECLRVDHL